ncbi:class II glutamine amidotransferase [Acrocarpospora corrugata]|uniref:Class II glutamine amidotransferase n=1 Tax=Acrocarpospora corrugata TaxID=35763 RepID=A0A5M3W9X3_9ACTN|nr:class II glutamine amidotransferase [Acrocarpospora corrugata]GES04812.1 class II glutamine amidotransferase [Acrocarpospora corrugata]
MCRLFGMSGAPCRTRATFWLLDAPDSLYAQSYREPDGAGLGYYDADGTPMIYKAPIAAYEDRKFATAARDAESTTFIAHVRYASTGGLADRNTHPFEQEGRLFAHNGVVEGLDLLDEHLGPDLAMVAGDTDSERVFALITREIRAHGGNVSAGITSAVQWIAAELPLYALNIVLITPTGLWALRYPDTHQLYLLDRDPMNRHLDHQGTGGRIRVRCTDMASIPCVVVASEPMDDNPNWELLKPGELIHAGANLAISRQLILSEPPARLMTLADLRPEAAASQGAGAR